MNNQYSRDAEGLLPGQHELLVFFTKPKCVALEDIAKQLGYDKATVSRQIKELVERDQLKRTRFTHVWGKPNQYETITP